jgi:hypothetical protein
MPRLLACACAALSASSVFDTAQETAAECCEACKRHTALKEQPGDCNSWVWCPEPLCWSPDIWNHTHKEARAHAIS